jgi:arylsulfatase A-like enzyme
MGESMNKNKEITRRDFLEKSSQLAAGGLAASALTVLNASNKKTNEKRPNLLFVFADQMRNHAMGCTGNEQIHTPNLDQLAREGILFSNAISTYPVCCPYRASLITGKYPLSHSVITNGPPLPDEELCIAEVLKQAGYQTGYIGKWHLHGHRYGDLGQFVPPGPKRQGFDYWAAANINHRYFDGYYYLDTDEKIPIEGWQPDTLTDLAIQYMEKQKEGSPFCLFLSWGPPHFPYIAPEKYLKMYDPEKIKLRDNVFHADKDIIANYYAATTSIDWNMGRLMEVLDKLGIADNTIVIFTSDHGDMLFSQHLLHKQFPYEESINVPFILRYPERIKPGQNSDLLIGTVDLMPTLLGLCNVEIPDTVEGKNLSSFILGENPIEEPEPDSVLIEVINPCASLQNKIGMHAWRGVRTKRYTYARFREKEWILMDNKYDPFQRRNLVFTPKYKELREKLHLKLNEWLKKTNDPFLPGDSYPRYEMLRNKPPLLKS